MYDKLIKCFRSLYTCTVITLDNVNPARAGWFWGQCTCVHIVYQEGMFPVSSCGFNALRNEVSVLVYPLLPHCFNIFTLE